LIIFPILFLCVDIYFLTVDISWDGCIGLVSAF
jgi:hypothetical protein